MKTHKKTYSLDHTQFETVNNSHTAYLLGLLWTDGYVSKKTNYITFSTTKSDYDDYIDTFNYTGDWKLYTYPSKNEWKDKVAISTTNKYLKDILVGLGFHEKEKGLSRLFNHVPKEYHSELLLGIIDGDGCFSVHTHRSSYRFSLCSCHEQNWESIEQILTECNIKFKLERTKSTSGSYSKIHVTNKMDVKKIGDLIYKNRSDHQLGLKRKYEKYLLTSLNCVKLRMSKDEIIHNL